MNKERPVLPNLVNEGTTEIEQFQNNILRPIIKMQHAIIIATFKSLLQKRKVDFAALPDKKKRSKISVTFKTDNNYKNIILGLIIGHFSMDEYVIYNNNSSEFNRRILQMISQRIKDSIEEIVQGN
tara:strand:+ start:32466 stop:32843 length:378 start_codon:yes stop_codon:yes gene_type:complete